MIQWFPGHMNKARRQIVEVIRDIDVIVEVLDARMPVASTNPMLEELRTYDRGGQPYKVPVIRLLNKSDLADAATTKQWLAKLSDAHTRTHVVQATEHKTLKQLPKWCKELASKRLEKNRTVRIMVQGVPNSGKSTLINTLKGHKVAKKGNEAAVTRGLQRVQLPNGLVLHDSPGLMWPKIEEAHQGFLLAMSGAIRSTAIDVRDLGIETADWLYMYHRQAIAGRYKAVAKLEGNKSGIDVLETIGRSRGCLAGGGDIDLHKASDILLNELRNGKLGRLSFETPQGDYRKHIVLKEGTADAPQTD